MHAAGDDTRPPGLVTCAKSRPVVAMKVFKERKVVAPVWVFLKLARSPVHRPPAILVLQEDAVEAARQLFCDLVQVHLSSRPSRAFDGEFIAVVAVILQQRPDNQAVYGHPDRPAPVGVAPEHASVRLRRQVRDAVVLMVRSKHIGVLGVIPGESPDAIGAEEFVLVQHLRQHPTKLGLVQNGRQSASATTDLDGVVDEGNEFWAGNEKPRNSSPSSGYFPTTSPSNTVTAHSGSSPTMERTFRR